MGFLWWTSHYAVCRECAAEILAQTTDDGEPRQEWQWARIVPGDPGEYAVEVNDEGT